MLRTDFTRTIERELKEKGKSLNVFGEEGQGLNQFVEDLKSLMERDVKFIRVSMRSYADRYEGFIKDIAGQLDIPNTNNQTSIWDLISRTIDASDKQICFCLEHFERLEEINTDPQYNREFLDYLNSLKNKSNVSLLLTSSHQIKTSELFINGEAVRGSMLETDAKPWTSLRLAEIEAFLLEKTSEKADCFKKNDVFRNLLVSKIAESTKPFDFLLYVAYNFYLHTDCTQKEFEKHIACLKSEFEKTERPSIGTRMNNVEKALAHFKWLTGRVFNIAKTLQWLKSKWIAIVLLLGATFCYKQIWAFIQSFFNH